MLLRLFGGVEFHDKVGIKSEFVDLTVVICASFESCVTWMG